MSISGLRTAIKECPNCSHEKVCVHWKFARGTELDLKNKDFIKTLEKLGQDIAVGCGEYDQRKILSEISSRR